MKKPELSALWAALEAVLATTAGDCRVEAMSDGPIRLLVVERREGRTAYTLHTRSGLAAVGKTAAAVEADARKQIAARPVEAEL